MPDIPDKKFHTLVEKLLHGADISDRRDAAISLSKIRSPEAIDALILSLGDHEDVAIFSMYALTEIGEDAVPSLVNSMKSANEQIRGYSVEILGELKAESALDDLIAIVEKDESNWVRNTAIEAIQMFDNQKVVTTLQRLLETADNWGVVSSCVALYRLKKDKKLVDLLISRIITQNDEERSMTAWALVEIAGKDELAKMKKIVDTNTDPGLQTVLNEVIRGISSR